MQSRIWTTRIPHRAASANRGRFSSCRLPAMLLAAAMVVVTVAGCTPGTEQSKQQEGLPTTGAVTGTTTPSTEVPPGEAEQAAGELTILCGTSFRPPMEKLVQMFEEQTGNKAVLSFGGSEDLLPQVKLKAAGDLFVTHDPYMDETEKAGAMLRWVRVGYLAPVLVVPKGNPKNVKSIEDLAKPGLQVLLTNPEFSTCGEMVYALLEKKGIKDAVLKNVGNAQFKHHSEVGNKLKLGFGDAGIMWNGVAHNFLDAIEIVPTPYEYDTEIRVGVIGLSYTRHKDLVEQFLQFVEKNGEKVFGDFGYVKAVAEK